MCITVASVVPSAYDNSLVTAVHCLLKISAQHSIYNNKCTKNLDYNHHILKAKMSWGKSARRREIIRILSSLHFNGHFSRHIWVKLVPEMSPSWILMEPSMMDGCDSWSYKTCKAPVKSSPPTNQHPVFLQA